MASAVVNPPYITTSPRYGTSRDFEAQASPSYVSPRRFTPRFNATSDSSTTWTGRVVEPVHHDPDSFRPTRYHTLPVIGSSVSSYSSLSSSSSGFGTASSSFNSSFRATGRDLHAETQALRSQRVNEMTAGLRSTSEIISKRPLSPVSSWSGRVYYPSKVYDALGHSRPYRPRSGEGVTHRVYHPSDVITPRATQQFSETSWSTTRTESF